MLPNCCSVRNKLRCVFGDHTDIKLDVFHAIQKFTRKMPKRHPHFQQCKDDLKLVVRNPSDTGDLRKELTALTEQMMINIEEFERKWTVCQYNDWKIVNEGVLRELAALKVHIRKGMSL